MELKGFYLF